MQRCSRNTNLHHHDKFHKLWILVKSLFFSFGLDISFWTDKIIFQISVFLWNVFHFDKWEFLIHSQEMCFVKKVLVNSVWGYSSIIYPFVFIFLLFLSDVAMWYTLSLWKSQYSISKPGHKCVLSPNLTCPSPLYVHLVPMLSDTWNAQLANDPRAFSPSCGLQSLEKRAEVIIRPINCNSTVGVWICSRFLRQNNKKEERNFFCYEKYWFLQSFWRNITQEKL